MSEGELAHQRWVYAQLDPALRPAVATWPWMVREEIGGVPVAFLHNALDETRRGFANPVSDCDPAAMDRLFAPCRAELVFYARLHYPSHVALEVVGRARCVTPGAVGCSRSRWRAMPWSTSTGRAPTSLRSRPCRTNRV